MEDAGQEFADVMMEILPPEPDCASGNDGALVCLCCNRAWPKEWMDQDGCGICEECISA